MAGSIQLRYVLYQMEGFIMFLPNFLIVLTILTQNALRRRKEYLLIGGQALADVLQGTALFAAGLHRTILIYQGRGQDTRTMPECVRVYFNMVWLIGDPLTVLMMVATSSDRLIAVYKPVKYRTLKKAYAYKVLGLMYGAAILNASVGIVWSHLNPDQGNYSAMCATGWSVPAPYYSWWKMVGISGASTSIAIYAVVFALYMRKQNQVGSQNSQDEAHDKQQRRLTQSLGITTSATLVLYIIPMIGMVYIKEIDLPPDQYLKIAVVLYMVTQTNCVINLMVYYKRLAPIRMGLQNTICCKGQLPQNLALVATTVVKRSEHNKN